VIPLLQKTIFLPVHDPHARKPSILCILQILCPFVTSHKLYIFSDVLSI